MTDSRALPSSQFSCDGGRRNTVLDPVPLRYWLPRFASLFRLRVLTLSGCALLVSLSGCASAPDRNAMSVLRPDGPSCMAPASFKAAMAVEQVEGG